MALKVGDLAKQINRAELTRFADVAPILQKNGWSTISIPRGTKKACQIGWQKFSLRQPFDSELARDIDQHPDGGAAIVCGGCCALDFDWLDADMANRAEAITRQIVPGDPLVRYGRWPKRALVYRTTVAWPTSRIPDADFLAKGSYLMAFGIHPVTKLPYWWDGDSPLTRPLADLPEITQEQLIAVRTALKQLSQEGIVPSEEAAAPSSDLDDVVMDGRDAVLTHIVWRIWASGISDRDEIIAKAWGTFAAKVDLVRPKRDGRASWSKRDVATKVDYLLRSGKTRPLAAATPDGTDPYQSFAHAIDRIAAYGRLAPATVRISHEMLKVSRGDRGCFMSAETLAIRLDLAVGTVKRARGKLVSMELWMRRVAGGGRGNLAHLFPNFDQARTEAEKVTKLGTGNSSEEEGDGCLGLTLEQNQIHESVFKSLGFQQEYDG